MDNEVKNLNSNNNRSFIVFIKIVIALFIAILSFTCLSKFASSPEFHKKSIQVLDQKKITIMELTAGAATVAITASLLLGERTEPLSDKLMDLTSYFLIILCAVILEKYLLTMIGFLSFKIILPLAAILYIICTLIKNKEIKKISYKLAIFSVVIFLVIPISVFISNLIEKTYADEIRIVLDSTKKITNDIKILNEESLLNDEETKNIDDENINNDTDIIGKALGIISKARDTIGATTSKIGNFILKSGSKLFNDLTRILGNLIEAIAIMLVTTCILPIFILLIFSRILKLFFDINVRFLNSKFEKK